MIHGIVDIINFNLDQCLNIDNAIYHGLTEIVEAGKERYPFGKGKICPNDKIPFMVYHRVEKYETIISKEYSFGVRETKEHRYQSRMTGVVLNSVIDSSPSLDIYGISLFIPQKIKHSDYKLITITPNTVTLDHDLIVNREWKNADYSKHKCKFTLFDIAYTITAIRCLPVCLNAG